MLKHFFWFERFITPKLIVVFFWLMVAMSSLAFLGTLFRLGQMGVLQLVIALIGWVIGIIFIKMFCEMILVGFKINENLQAIRERGDKL